MSLENMSRQENNEHTAARPGRLANRLASFDEEPQPQALDPIDAIGQTEAYVAADEPRATVAPDVPEVLRGAQENLGGGEPAPKKKNRAWIAPVVALGVVAAAYLGGVYAFSTHYLPNTTVDGVDVSLKTRSYLAESINSQTSSYTLAVTGDGVELALAASDVDLGYNGDACADEAFSQTNPWQWPLEIAKSRNIEVQKTVSYDKEKVAAALAPYVEQSRQKAEEAANASTISYDSAKASFVLNGGGDTRCLDADKAAEKVCGALDSLDASLTLGDECMSSGEDFSQALASANAYLDAAPTLTLAGSTVTEIGADQIASWLKFGDDLAVELDESAITTWCQGDLSKQCDTVGTTRTYTRPDGKTVEVSGGTYGWNINGAETATQIADALRSGQKTSIEIPVKSAGASYAAAAGGKDWGNRYIDVDLTEQHARMYDASGNLIWETDIVTGDTTQGHDTPTGVYAMDSYRASGDVELRGAIDATTGEPEYISHVDYWMPFIGNSYALHDADWRSKFGGTIYQGNGSHGCVNLPVDKAAELWNLTAIGDVVVVHN